MIIWVEFADEDLGGKTPYKVSVLTHKVPEKQTVDTCICCKKDICSTSTVCHYDTISVTYTLIVTSYYAYVYLLS